MNRRARVWAVWASLFTLFAAPVVIYQPFTAFGVPVWGSLIIGAVASLGCRVLAEVLVDLRDRDES